METELGVLLRAQMPDALVGTDADGLVELWNPAAQAIFGYSASEALGRPLADLIVPDELRDDEILIRREAVAGTSERHETLRRRKDGMPIYINCNTRAVLDDQGKLVHLVSCISDATRYRAQRDSRLMHARFHEVLESAPDAVVVVNGTGRIVLFNTQARAMFGYDEATVLGEPIEILLPRRLSHSHVAQRTGFIGSPRVRAMGEGRELHGLRSNGEEFPVEISLSPVETESGRMVMSAIRDISERKRFERALHEKNLELQAASQAKDRFLATMSHELRTPLNAIVGFTGVLLMRLPGPLTTDQEHQLQLVEGSAKHLLSLINDLLDLAKIESGNVELRLGPVACAPVLEAVMQTLKQAARAKGLAMVLDAPEPQLSVLGDRRALQQIMLNLANNAIKFTHQGSVTVSMHAVVEGEHHLVELAVNDTGVGIAPEDLARLFQKFSRVGSSEALQIEGSGLGLHLSQRLARLMGSRVDVHSEAGRGSRFALRLQAMEA